MYEVRLGDRALRELGRLPANVAERLLNALERLAQWPEHHADVKQLAGEWAGFFRLRVGDYRLIFDVDEAQSRITVTRVSKRQRAYRA